LKYGLLPQHKSKTKGKGKERGGVGLSHWVWGEENKNGVFLEGENSPLRQKP